jgi:Domain of unknown function (DUF4302)
VGQGLLSDFEFIIKPDDLAGDTLKLTGKVNGAQLVMTKATAEEATIFLSGQWVLLENYLTQKLLTYYKRIIIGGVAYDLSSDPVDKTITFQKVDGSTVTKHTTGYYNTLNGIILYDPLTTGSGSVSQITAVGYDEATNTLNVQAGSENTSITETIFPLVIETSAPQEWWNFAVNNGGSFWITIDGFHVDGVDDAFNLHGLVSGSNNYYFFLYWPDFATGSNDLFAPVFRNAAQNNSLIYGAAPEIPNWSANGIQSFVSLGNYTFTRPPVSYPTDPNNPARLTRNLFFQPEGFYFVKISDTIYDMVSAANGRAWLRWYF